LTEQPREVEVPRFWRNAPGWIAFLFAVAAPWSIAAAQGAVLLGAVVVAAGLALRHLRPPPSLWPLLPIPVFLGFQVLSIPLGVHPARSLGLLQGSWTLLFPFLFLAMLQEEGATRRALSAFAASAAGAGLLGLSQHFAGRDWLRPGSDWNLRGSGHMAIGSFGGHLTYAGVLLPALFVAAGLVLTRQRRWPWILAFAAIGLGILFSYARTAWLGSAAGLVILGMLRGRRRVVLYLAAGALAMLLVALLLEPSLRERVFSIFQIGEDPRSRLWGTALRIVAGHRLPLPSPEFQARPGAVTFLFGAGLGAFKKLFPYYKLPGEYMATGHPHSDILNHLVETGVLGAAAWISIWVAFFAATRRGRTPLVDGLRCGVAALLVAGLGQCFSTAETVAQAWWFVVAAALALTRPPRDAGAPPVSLRRNARWKDLVHGVKAVLLAAATLLLASRPRGRAPTSARTGPAEGSPRGRTDGDSGEVGNAGNARLLVLRLDNRLGNLLLLTPFLQRLRESFPAAHLGFVSGEAYANVLRDWPWIDEWIVQPKRRHASFPPLFLPWAVNLRRRGWDLAFEASNPDTHSFYNCLLALATGAPERIGFDHPRSRRALTRAVPPPEADLHFSLAPLRLLRALGAAAPAAPMRCPVTSAPSPAFVSWRAREGIRGNHVVVHLGGRDTKAWPEEGWARLLPELMRTVPGPVVLVAGPAEQARLDVLWLAPGPRPLRAPVLSGSDLVHLLRDAAGFVGCDSGVMHLAVAVDTPTTAIFFRSNPWRYAPLGAEHRTVLLADPWRVDDDAWTRPVETMPRSPILRACDDGAASRAGTPRVDPGAVETIIRALDETRRREGAPPAGNRAGRARA
jgi:ADP-heptose:LPS heptosyltransferase/O-antigen ligase